MTHTCSCENSDANTDDKLYIIQNVRKGPYMQITHKILYIHQAEEKEEGGGGRGWVK
jgi:hypothetical protein